jgi:methionyl-tRNA formyltransferase
MRVLTIVNGYTGALCLQEVVDQGDEVVGVICNAGDPRPGADPKTSVKLTADRNGLPVYQPARGEVNSPKYLEIIRKLKPDLIVSMHYAVIFNKELLSIPSLGCVNEHPSRLPAGQGMTPSYWHMIIGDPQNWISLHYLNEGIDKGDIIAEGGVDVLPEDTGATSARKLSEVGHRLLAENLPLIREGRCPRISQREYGRIHGIKRSYVSWKATDAQVDWTRSAKMLALHAASRPGWDAATRIWRAKRSRSTRPRSWPTRAGAPATPAPARRLGWGAAACWWPRARASCRSTMPTSRGRRTRAWRACCPTWARACRSCWVSRGS